MTLLIRTYLNNLKIKLLSKNTLFCWGNLTKKKGEIKNYLIRSKEIEENDVSKINKVGFHRLIMK